jgi:hypothetical protein
MKRTVLILGGAAAIAAGVVSAIDFSMTTSPHYPFSFDFGILLGLPAYKILRTLNLENSTNQSLWAFSEIGSNTLLGFAAGALFGCVLYGARRLVVHTRSKHEGCSG